MSPIPIIVIGRDPKIVIKVGEGMMPEYDVVHIITTVEQGLSDLPLLLSNPSRTPVNADGNIGSKNYGSRPLAVAAGGGFNDEMFNKMKAACKDVEQGIVWVRADTSKFASMPSLSDTDAFGMAMAQRVKARLNELGVGKEGNKSGLYLF